MVTQRRWIWYNDCAERNPARYRAAPLCGDYTGKPRLGKKMPPAASLSSLRTWYNDCAERNPARYRAAPLCGDYTGKLRTGIGLPAGKAKQEVTENVGI